MATFQDLQDAIGILATARQVAKDAAAANQSAQTALQSAQNNVKVIVDALTAPS